MKINPNRLWRTIFLRFIKRIGTKWYFNQKQLSKIRTSIERNLLKTIIQTYFLQICSKKQLPNQPNQEASFEYSTVYITYPLQFIQRVLKRKECSTKLKAHQIIFTDLKAPISKEKRSYKNKHIRRLQFTTIMRHGSPLF